MKMKKTKKGLAILIACALTMSFLPMENGHAETTKAINVSINTNAENAKISPYIYGANYDSGSATKPITEGVVRFPSLLGITTGSLPSITDTQELVVPKSIPIIFPISTIF